MLIMHIKHGHKEKYLQLENTMSLTICLSLQNAKLEKEYNSYTNLKRSITFSVKHFFKAGLYILSEISGTKCKV